MPDNVIRIGQTYYCTVCGSEVTVIRAMEGDLVPVCCKRPMRKRPELLVVYHCNVCGAEVMVLHGDSENVQPHCCNRPMVKLKAA
jgi:desulfoferrodoxin-like iron-binding protein